MDDTNSVSQARKRLTTYGKASRKRVAQASESQNPMYATVLPTGGRRNPSPDHLPDRSISATHQKQEQPRSVVDQIRSDVFEFPSSEEDEKKASKTKRRKLIPTQETSIDNKLTSQNQLDRVEKPTLLGAAPHLRMQASNETTSRRKPAKEGIPAAEWSIRQSQPLFSPSERSKNLLDDKKRSGQVSDAPISIPSSQPAGIAANRLLKKRRMSPEPTFRAISASTSPLPDDRTRNPQKSTSPAARVLTPKGQKMWDNLLIDHGKNLPSSQGIFNSTRRSLMKDRGERNRMPRRRLIDSLIHENKQEHPQSAGSTRWNAEENRSSDSGEDRGGSPDNPYYDGGPCSPTVRAASISVELIPSGTGNQSSQSTGPKITYSRQRTMLAELEMSEKIAFSTSLETGVARGKRRGSVPAIHPLQTSKENEEIEHVQSGNTIRTLHELRQAGAQSRFLDEMDDLLDRVGSPASQISLRRSSLLELTEKMMEKEFQDRFISNGLDQRLFIHLGQEQDIICGYLLLGLLLMMLSLGTTSSSVSQLRRQGLTRLLVRSLDYDQSIESIAQNRAFNVSKHFQPLLSQLQEKFGTLEVWGEKQPEIISPRILALRSVEMMVRQLRQAGNTEDLLSKELVGRLFGILMASIIDKSVSTTQTSMESYLALSTLESHSLKATSTLNEYLPAIRDILEDSLRYAQDNAEILLLTLRLTLNVTNSDANATEIFVTPQIVQSICEAMVSRFQLLANFLIEEERISTLDHVILMSGVLMNFALYSAAARTSFGRFHEFGWRNLDDMITLFRENREKIAEADSVEDTQRNVAFGYLGVVLGYFVLVQTLQKHMIARLENLEPLISSNEEFISHHQRVDELLKGADEAYSPQIGLTERLRDMVAALRAVPS